MFSRTFARAIRFVNVYLCIAYRFTEKLCVYQIHIAIFIKLSNIYRSVNYHISHTHVAISEIDRNKKHKFLVRLHKEVNKKYVRD